MCGLNPSPSCCGGYCGETPVVELDSSTTGTPMFMGGMVTAECVAGPPPPVTACCNASSISLPAGAPLSEVEWSVGFDDPMAAPDASIDASTPVAKLEMPTDPAAPSSSGPTSSAGDQSGGCAVGGRRGGSLGELLVVLGLVAALRRRRA
jgi:hypothetical protein